MAFKRNVLPQQAPEYGQLSGDLAGLGMRFSARANYEANVEDTILSASFEGMMLREARTLEVLTNWIDVYFRLINVSRLAKLVQGAPARLQAYQAGIASWKRNDHRFRRLAGLYSGPRVTLDGVEGGYLFDKHGENPRFEGSALLVPGSYLVWRNKDVVSIEEVQERNLFIRYRLIMGASYRADMWALLDLHPELTPAALAKQTYGSFATAWQVRRDWRLVHGGQERK